MPEKYLFQFFICDIDSIWALFLVTLMSYIADCLLYKSAAYVLLEINKTNRQKKETMKIVYNMSFLERRYMRNYSKLVSSHKKIMIFIIIENFLFHLLSDIMILILIIGMCFNELICIWWIIAILKLVLCDAIGFVFSIIFGGMGHHGGTYWRFK